MQAKAEAGFGILEMIGGEPVRCSCDVQQDDDGGGRGMIGGEMEGILSGRSSTGMFTSGKCVSLSQNSVKNVCVQRCNKMGFSPSL
jgi:hypothetical protein